MDAASGSQPARGVVVAPLIESHPDRIVVGSSTLFLSEGMACGDPPGTTLEVEYTKQNGRRQAEKITPVSPRK